MCWDAVPSRRQLGMTCLRSFCWDHRESHRRSQLFTCVCQAKNSHFNGINDNKLYALEIVHGICGTRTTATKANVCGIFCWQKWARVERSDREQDDGSEVKCGDAIICMLAMSERVPFARTSSLNRMWQGCSVPKPSTSESSALFDGRNHAHTATQVRLEQRDMPTFW